MAAACRSTRLAARDTVPPPPIIVQYEALLDQRAQGRLCHRTSIYIDPNPISVPPHDMFGTVAACLFSLCTKPRRQQAHL